MTDNGCVTRRAELLAEAANAAAGLEIAQYYLEGERRGIEVKGAEVIRKLVARVAELEGVVAIQRRSLDALRPIEDPELTRQRKAGRE